MNTLYTLNFALRLIFAKKLRSFLVIFSILIGTSVLFVFLSFSQGIEEVVLKPIMETASPNTLVVSNDVFSVGFFDVNKGKKLNQESVDKIKSFPEVGSVGRLLTLKFPSSIQVWLFGYNFETDSPVFGIDREYLGEDAPENFTEFIRGKDEKMVPVAISPRIIDAFNASLAESVDGIPHLDSKNLYDRRFQIAFGKSTIFSLSGQEPIYKSAQIKTVSARIPMLGIAIPIETALEISEKFGENKDIVFSKLYVESNKVEDVKKIQEKISAMGLKSKTFDEIGKEVISLLLSLKITLLISSALIIFISILSLFSLVSISIMEQKETIGILRSIGEKKIKIIAIFVYQGVLIGLTGAIIGLLCGYLIGTGLDKILMSKIPDISLKPESFFPFNLNLVLWILLSVILSSLFASFLPARKAVEKDPLEAIIRK